MRIGHGFDVHRFGEGSFVTLGGVKIPFHKGLIAHSDGDVLIHAVCDALLGACGLGDIGRHFPDTDPQYKGIDSRQLLRHVVALVNQQGWQLLNMDATIIAQAPKMLPHIEKMKTLLAEDLAADLTQINIKATTTEQLGFVGREEGIATHAVVLLAPYERN
ncbi:2-C-methyl-D-erythritol 2,4-cyclodiphosphate synthase [Gammaproteobacteria bacterium ESL0073]|uniref:2-C-methyl-D-erythritol 2,4-cyclodiphosphate synthase n=1 Tax=Entomomonas moraniae TaxID=2213226 RepID=A0A3Q9JGW7_9GAMM|nr:2-C-methyl-D-erythritol 2,4-cyclodiphosphate synthase [Entomomonas moraniae]AWM81046.1 2-C-methyl-D-erythritol 2,4-cyclodiphosphate synthase [Gammaproteobacteria bacterium ESL0073]AZS49261.1 2-C-methyl-D-erythritol 2,4-cyclodiphosphate synthase [Entomomonas moraniae]